MRLSSVLTWWIFDLLSLHYRLEKESISLSLFSSVKTSVWEELVIFVENSCQQMIFLINKLASWILKGDYRLVARNCNEALVLFLCGLRSIFIWCSCSEAHIYFFSLECSWEPIVTEWHHCILVREWDYFNRLIVWEIQESLITRVILDLVCWVECFLDHDFMGGILEYNRP